MGKIDPQESRGKTLVALCLCMGLMFVGLWIFAQEGTHPDCVLGIPIVLAGTVLYIVIAVRT